MKVVRRALVVAFLGSTILALYTDNIVSFVATFLPLTMSGLGVVVLLGRFWPRANWQGAMAALLTTPLVALTVNLIPARTESLEQIRPSPPSRSVCWCRWSSAWSRRRRP